LHLFALFKNKPSIFKMSTFVIFGIKLPRNYKIPFALSLLYGIGPARGKEICNSLGLPPQLSVKELTSAQQFAIAKKLKEDYRVESNLEEQLKKDIQRLQQNGSRRGYRLRNGLPTRGQRTHSNCKTSRKRTYIRSLLSHTFPHLRAS
jgi:small subunit ribosomal protein S13